MTLSFKSLCIGALLCFISIPAIAGDSAGQGALRMLDADHPIHIPAKSVIVAEGDSLTYGMDTTSPGKHFAPLHGLQLPRSPTPYPETLAADLGNKVMIVNHGFPGDRTIDGLIRWAHAPPGDLVLILYGTNDCENYGNIPGGDRSPESYHAALAELVKRRQAEGAQVVLLTLPPLKDSDQEKKLEFYRPLVDATARETGAYLFDTMTALRKMSNPWLEDGIHLSPEAYVAIAHALAADIKLERKPKS